MSAIVESSGDAPVAAAVNAVAVAAETSEGAAATADEPPPYSEAVAPGHAEVAASKPPPRASTSSPGRESYQRQLTFGSVQVGQLEGDETDGVTFAPLHDEDEAPNREQGTRQLTRGSGRSESNFSIRANLGGNVDLSWHNVIVTLPKDESHKRPNPKVILQNINGRIEAGNLMALMGASGAGKTTFLNMISGRSAPVLEVEGVMAINGKSVTPNSIRKVAAYIQQQDVFLPNLTVYEHLYVQAMLRMDTSMEKEERIAQIHSVMHELGLTKIEHTRIGSPITGSRGISGGEAKRLAFASEILTDPPLLFADEPTSGLDSFAAQNVVQALKNLADNGRTIICTIHQPPSEVFSQFHKLLLFAEGRTAYLGNLSGAPAVFAGMGYPCPPNYNHADFYIHTLAIAPGKEAECKERVKVITEAYHEKEVAEGSIQDPEPESPQMAQTLREMGHRRGQPWPTQFRLILWRSYISATREFQVVGVQLAQTLVMGLLFGLVFLQIDEGHGQARNQNISGSGLMVLISATFTVLYPVVQVLPGEVIVVIRDHDNHMYRTWIYYVTKFIAEIPITVLFITFFSIVTYFMIGFRLTADAFFFYYGVMILTVLTARALGFFISAVAFDNSGIALAIVTPIVIPFLLFSGVFINSSEVPSYLIWVERLSVFKYEFEAFMIREWRDRPLGNCTGVMEICFENGNDVLQILGFGNSVWDMQQNLIILIALGIAYFLLGLIILTLRIHYIHR